MRMLVSILVVGGLIWLYMIYLWQPALFHHWVNQATYMLR
jgi:hypothetical protein